MGRLVRTRRLTKGISLRKTAERSGVSPMWLSKLERGYIGTPNPAKLRRLGLVIGVSYTLLMQRAGYPLPSGDGERALD